MRKVNIINNYDEQIKSLNDNNIPYKYYNPSTNLNIRNYLSANDIIYDCEPNSYLSLNELMTFVNDLNTSKNYDNNYVNYDLGNSKNEKIYGKIDDNEINHQTRSVCSENYNRKLVNEKNMANQAYNSYNYNSSNNYYNNSNYNTNSNNYINNNSNYNINSSNYYNSNNHNYNNNNHNYDISNNHDFNSSNHNFNSTNNCNINNNKDNVKNHNVMYSLKDETCNPKKNKNIYKKVNMQESPKSHINSDNTLLKDLLECRTNLAKKNNIKDPEKLISTKNLKLLLLHRPNSVEEIKNLNLTGFGDDKIKKYSHQFLKVFLYNYNKKKM